MKKYRTISAITKDTWEEIAEDYHRHRTSGTSMNELIEIPAMKKLVGGVSGLTVLDAGCGYGHYAIWAKRQGAKKVIGMDISEKMIEMAREKTKEKKAEVDFIQGDLFNLNQFKDGYFDLIMSSIVVSYFGDLVKYFSEFARVLKRKGIFVFSEVHPMRTAGKFVAVKKKKVLQVSNYMPAHFEKDEGHWRDEKGKLVPINFYHYPLSDFSQALKRSGFLIEKIVEPRPIKKMKKILPEKYERLSRIPLFILIRARKL